MGDEKFDKAVYYVANAAAVIAPVALTGEINSAQLAMQGSYLAADRVSRGTNERTASHNIKHALGVFLLGMVGNQLEQRYDINSGGEIPLMVSAASWPVLINLKKAGLIGVTTAMTFWASHIAANYNPLAPAEMASYGVASLVLGTILQKVGGIVMHEFFGVGKKCK